MKNVFEPLRCALAALCLIFMPLPILAQDIIPLEDGKSIKLTIAAGTSALIVREDEKVEVNYADVAPTFSWVRIEDSGSGFLLRLQGKRKYLALGEATEGGLSVKLVDTKSPDAVWRFQQDAEPSYIVGIRDGKVYRLASARDNDLWGIFAQAEDARVGKALRFSQTDPTITHTLQVHAIDVGPGIGFPELAAELTFADNSVLRVEGPGRGETSPIVWAISRHMTEMPQRVRIFNVAEDRDRVAQIEYVSIRDLSNQLVVGFPSFDKRIPGAGYAWSFYAHEVIEAANATVGRSLLSDSSQARIDARAEKQAELFAKDQPSALHATQNAVFDQILVTEEERSLFARVNTDLGNTRIDTLSFIQQYMDFDEIEVSNGLIGSEIASHSDVPQAVRSTVAAELAMLLDARRELMESYRNRRAFLQSRYAFAREEIAVFQRYSFIQSGDSVTESSGTSTSLELQVASALLVQVPVIGPVIGKLGTGLAISDKVRQLAQENNKVTLTAKPNRATTKTEVRNRTLIAINNVLAGLKRQEENELKALDTYYRALLTDLLATRHIQPADTLVLTQEHKRDIRRVVWGTLLPVRTSLVGGVVTRLRHEKPLQVTGDPRLRSDKAALLACTRGAPEELIPPGCDVDTPKPARFAYFTMSPPVERNAGSGLLVSLWGWRLVNKPWDAPWAGGDNPNDLENLGAREFQADLGKATAFRGNLNGYLAQIFDFPESIEGYFARQDELFAQSQYMRGGSRFNSRSEFEAMTPALLARPGETWRGGLLEQYTVADIDKKTFDDTDSFLYWQRRVMPLSKADGRPVYRKHQPANPAFVYRIREWNGKDFKGFGLSGWAADLFFEQESYFWPDGTYFRRPENDK